VLLFIGADVLIIYVWQLRRKVRVGRSAETETAEGAV
jgi:hypothetical protein